MSDINSTPSDANTNGTTSIDMISSIMKKKGARLKKSKQEQTEGYEPTGGTAQNRPPGLPLTWDQVELAKRDIQGTRYFREGPMHPYKKFLFLYEGDFDKQAEAEADFAQRRDKCLGRLDLLEAEAKRGEFNGLRELALLAYESAERLERWEHWDRDDPEAVNYRRYLAEVARHYPRWPVLVTNTSGSKVQKERLKAIELDQARPFLLPGEKIFKSAAPGKTWARRLFTMIDSLRRLQGTGQEAAGMPKRVWQFRRVPLDPDLLKLNPKKRRWLRRAVSLKPFSSQSKTCWWELAKEIFLALTNNEPWKLTEFHSLPDIKDSSKEGEKRNAVVWAVQQPFLNLSPI